MPEGTPGAFWIRGRVFDGDGEPVPDALVETWQADPDGRYDHPDDPRGRGGGFRGFGRCADRRRRPLRDLHGEARAGPGAGGATQAPHLDVSVFARGLLNRVVTRDLLRRRGRRPTRPTRCSPAVPERPARARCSPSPTDDGYRFDVRLQGEGETVFFAV